MSVIRSILPVTICEMVAVVRVTVAENGNTEVVAVEVTYYCKISCLFKS